MLKSKLFVNEKNAIDVPMANVEHEELIGYPIIKNDTVANVPDCDEVVPYFLGE